MEHLSVPQFLGVLVLTLAMAKLFGGIAKAVGQPTVLGELLAGIVLGGSVLGVLHPDSEMIHLLAELGVIVLLFAIGLETDIGKLMMVGGSSLAVAVVGLVLPFVLGYGVCHLLGFGGLVAIVAGASLTATSVGITARVLSDLGRLQEPESQIILGAAVIDDIIGLIILTVVSGLVQGEQVTAWGVARITGSAFGFLVGTLVVGSLIIPHVLRLAGRVKLPATPTILAVILALGLAWLADKAGSAVIIGAFVAGVLLAKTPKAHEIEHGITELGNFFVPIFFASVGAAVDLRVFNPTDPANRTTLMVGGLLILVAVFGKFAAGPAVQGEEERHRGRDDSSRRGGPHLRPDGAFERRVRREALRGRHAHGARDDVPRPSAPEGSLPPGRAVIGSGRGRRD
jgi:Kef-type K+ transport system membrane component KefB